MTQTIPIVMVYATDPVALGFVASLARPGGNITGLSAQSLDITRKRLQLLKETIPTLGRVAVFWDTSTPKDQLNAIKLAARTLALKVDTLEIRGLNDVESSFGAAAKLHCQGVVVLSSPFTSRRGKELAAASVSKRLPTISMFQENVTDGCLMSYGPNLADGYRHLGSLAGRILKGARPADLPIEQPSKLELFVNLKAAKALGLTVPPLVLGQADQVID